MNEQEAAKLVALALTGLPNLQDKELRPTARLWAVLMPDIDYKTGQVAIIRIMREKKIATLPLPAEIIEIARELRKRPDTPPAAIEAWEEVRKKADPYKIAKWSHPAIETAVKRIGVRAICSESNVAQRFMDVYSQIVRRQAIDHENKIAIQIAANGKIRLISP